MCVSLILLIFRAARLQNSNHELSALDAQREARVVEQDVRAKAASRAEYDASCTAIVPEADDAADFWPPTDTLLDSEPEQSIGTYTQARHYKDGLFSTVFKATSTSSPSLSLLPSALVALKQTFPSRMTPPHSSTREVNILRSLSHPNIIPLLETFSLAGGQLFLVFPFCPLDLAALLRHLQTISTTSSSAALVAHRKRLLSHLHDLFSALAHLHANAIIHRDIKPSNILLASPTGPAYLADFGIAWSPAQAPVSGSDSAIDKITDVGTTCYRPPELLFGHTGYSTALDLWAAGCVVAEVVDAKHRQLFDAGELGSELALIKSIFTTLGTPTTQVWPEASSFRDWGKMAFREYPKRAWQEVLEGVADEAICVVDGLVRYDSEQRLSAEEVLLLRLFEGVADVQQS